MTDLFFDNASTTACGDEVTRLIQRFADEEYGNPSSAHAFGRRAGQAIQEARTTFADFFNATPAQIIFTGSGTESDNLALYGTALDAIARKKSTPRVLVSASEHPAIRKAALSLSAFGVEVHLIPVDAHGQIKQDEFKKLLTPNTTLVSIHRVNNITGSLHPIEELAALTKTLVPSALFHTDAVQAFGKVSVPKNPSQIDMVSISAHKICGPKGVGALVLLNPRLLKEGLRPMIWGGDQEGGFRSGTQNPGLIAGFRAAAQHSVNEMENNISHTAKLRARFELKLKNSQWLSDSPTSRVRWNSPILPGSFVPYIVNVSVPGIPGGVMAKMLEERHCLVSTGSACSSKKAEPDHALSAMGLPAEIYSSAIRISFSVGNSLEDVDRLVTALGDSIGSFDRLMAV